MSGRKTSDDEFLNLVRRLDAWDVPADSIDRLHDLSRASLNEVEALTEYEDGKVSRLLTVITFLSAVVAAVFTRFAADYSLPPVLHPVCSAAWILPMATYVSFLGYVLLVTFAVWSAIGAVRPKFVIPETWRNATGKEGPTSMIFYKGILDTNPVEWGRTFEDQAARDKADKLKATYAKNYIAEAYLVAQKVAEKLESLKPGIAALRIALGLLMVFLAAYAATIASVDPTRPAAAPPAVQTKSG